MSCSRTACWRGSERRAGTSTGILKVTLASSQKHSSSLFKWSEATVSPQSVILSSSTQATGDSHTSHTHPPTVGVDAYGLGAGVGWCDKPKSMWLLAWCSVATCGTKVNMRQLRLFGVTVFFKPVLYLQYLNVKTLWNLFILMTWSYVWLPNKAVNKKEGDAVLDHSMYQLMWGFSNLKYGMFWFAFCKKRLQTLKLESWFSRMECEKLSDVKTDALIYLQCMRTTPTPIVWQFCISSEVQTIRTSRLKVQFTQKMKVGHFVSELNIDQPNPTQWK